MPGLKLVAVPDVSLPDGTWQRGAAETDLTVLGQTLTLMAPPGTTSVKIECFGGGGGGYWNQFMAQRLSNMVLGTSFHYIVSGL